MNAQVKEKLELLTKFCQENGISIYYGKDDDYCWLELSTLDENGKEVADEIGQLIN